jgi:hypothetical protein
MAASVTPANNPARRAQQVEWNKGGQAAGNTAVD